MLKRFAASFLLTISLGCALSALAQQTLKIAKIEFNGLDRLSPQQAMETSALEAGQTFELALLDAAAQRLMDSGLFKSVSYRTHGDHGQITITFQVEETKGGDSRVVFDNFVWFSDEELFAAVRRDVPTFTGTAPDNGATIDAIKRALRGLLQEHHIDATVEYMTSQDSPTSIVQEHVFSVSGVSLPVCTIHFPGASGISETRLIENSKGLTGGAYSKKFSSLFAVNNLFPLYRELGQLRATFAPPSGKPENGTNCKSGVEVTIPVDEGLVYNWDKADWSGINALTAQELNAALGMKAEQPANGLEFDKGLLAVHKAYGRKGYLAASVRPRPEFDDNAHKVVYKMDVREGPQYRMGALSVKGLSESVAKSFADAWKLKAGDVFDQDYIFEFRKQMTQLLSSTLLDRRAQGKPAPNMKIDVKRNSGTRTCDVTMELTN